MALNRDPEVLALTSQIRALTRQARTLSAGIDETLTELGEYTAEITAHREQDRRRQSRPFTGAERRHDR